MDNTIEVTTSVGNWVLKKPKAGVRNRALASAEYEPGKIKQTAFMMELLPKCVQRRPDGFDSDVPINQVIDDLDTDVYDDLAVGLSSLIAGEDDEEKKTKSTDTSTQA